MTVGISLSNGLEAVIVTDTRASTQSRHSDMIEKSAEFKADHYHGTLFGSGLANLVLEVFSALPGLSSDDLDLAQYATKVQGFLKEKRDGADRKIIAAMKEDIHKRAEIFATDEERKAYIKQETERALKEYEGHQECSHHGKDPIRATNFVLVGFDAKSSRVRGFTIYSSGLMEVFSPQLMTGSGTDGADMYFQMKLQGIDTKNLTIAELVLHALNAYGYATVNEGVGGTPKIVHVSRGGIVVVPRDNVAAVSNLCHAYLAGFDTKLDRATTLDLVNEGLKESPRYDGIAQLLALNVETLTTMAIPYSTWQERANSRPRR